jgi:hypothetical protein
MNQKIELKEPIFQTSLHYEITKLILVTIPSTVVLFIVFIPITALRFQNFGLDELLM